MIAKASPRSTWETARAPDDSVERPREGALDAALASLLEDISARGRGAFDGVLSGDDPRDLSSVVGSLQEGSLLERLFRKPEVLDALVVDVMDPRNRVDRPI